MNQVWTKDLVNKTLGTLLVLLLIFAVIRPATRSLVSFPAHVAETDTQFNGISGAIRKGHGGAPESDGLGGYEKNMNIATRVVENDLKLVAQIIKNWVSADGA